MAKTSTVTIARAFDHKQHGRIGIVNMTAEVGTVTIDGKELPASSVEYLLTFALQNLQDSYAGADSADDAKARFAKKLERLLAGTIGVREAGDGASAETKMVRTVFGDMLRKAKKWDDVMKGVDEDARPAKLDELFAKQPDALREAVTAKAKERIAELANRAKQTKELAASIQL